MTTYHIHQGDNIPLLKTIGDGTIDSIITDPPYGIEFLGKDWDSNTGVVETWRECIRVLKPGGHLLAFSAARTYHHLASNIESVGFEIRDQLMWLYASGFPKAQDIGKAIQRRQGVEQTKKYNHNTPVVGGTRNTEAYDMCKEETVPTAPQAQQWAGWKTALKPAHEPIVMARKPFKGSCIDNVLAHGVGALNIDATRIPHEVEDRFPSNVMGTVEGYQKFFYCPKVSRKERHVGFEQTMTKPDMLRELGGYFVDHNGDRTEKDTKMCWIPSAGKIYAHGLKHEYEKVMKHNKDLGKHKDPLAHIEKPFQVETQFDIHKRQDGVKNAMIKQAENTTKTVGNNHPTVKPVALMRYLIELVTPANSKVLDPFCGSGSTGMAAVELGHEFVGMELDANYCAIAMRRIEGWAKLHTTAGKTTQFDELFDEDD